MVSRPAMGPVSSIQLSESGPGAEPEKAGTQWCYPISPRGMLAFDDSRFRILQPGLYSERQQPTLTLHSKWGACVFDGEGHTGSHMYSPMCGVNSGTVDVCTSSP